MIVHRTPTSPRGPIHRGLRALGIATPVVLLAAVAGAGLAGQRAEVPPRASFGAGASPSMAAIASTAPASPPGVPDGPPTRFPGVAATLSVRSVPEARVELAAATGRPLAIAGWLTSIVTDEHCATAVGDTRGPLSPLCERTARLVAAEPGTTGTRAHVHVLVPPGVRLPPPLEWPGAQRAAPVPVVLVGRSPSPDSDCLRSTRGCGERFTLDLVTWASGEAFDPGPIFDAGLEIPPAAIAYRYREKAERLVTGRTGTVLVSAVVRPATVAAIDPEAGLLLARVPRPEGLVWYVRGLEPDGGPGRYPPGDRPARERWVVLDESTGRQLATGITGQPAQPEVRGTDRITAASTAPVDRD